MMQENYPLHIMVKPEGLALFPDYITAQLQLFEVLYSRSRIAQVQLVLTPEEVDMIYPEGSVPRELKKFLTEQTTEHLLLHGGSDIYEKARALKGKYGGSAGIRPTLFAATDKMGITLKKWQNFLHTSDDDNEARKACHTLNMKHDACLGCVAEYACRTT